MAIDRDCKVIVTVTDCDGKRSLDLDRKLAESIYEFRTRVLNNISNILPDYREERMREYHE